MRQNTGNHEPADVAIPFALSYAVAIPFVLSSAVAILLTSALTLSLAIVIIRAAYPITI